MRTKGAIHAIAALALLTGCSTKAPEPGSIVKAWSEGVANLGIRAVYPLQENLYPGNIILSPSHPGKSRSDEKPARFYTFYPIPVGTLDLCKLYLPFKAHPELPKTSGYTASGEEKAITPWEPTEIKYSHFKCGDYSGVDFRLNRAMAFPAFSFASLIETAVGGNLMAGTTGIKGGAAGKNDYTVTVSVPSATVIRVDVSDLLMALDQGTYNPSGKTSLQSIVSRMLKMQTYSDAKGNSSPPELLLVSEVYYANAIDVSITANSAQIGNLAISTQSLIERFEKLTALRTQLELMTATAQKANNKNIEGASEAIKQIHQRIAVTEADIEAISKSIIPSAPGITGAVKSVTGSGVTLTQVFPRPMAVGYRAVGLNPNQFLITQ